eukprot:jgi/Chrpa1/17259/Chrysochromulina_OHIO_Genome00004509-RA
MAARIASFPFKNAAVSTVLPRWPGPAGAALQAALLITTYAAFGKEPVSIVANIEDVLAGKIAAAPVTLESMTGWTNYAELVPEGALPVSASSRIVATAGGFLVPGHQTGSIDLFHVTAPNNVSHAKISTDKEGFFYHKIVWHDCDGDGRLDVMAARAKVPNVGEKQGELIWLEQPAAGALNGTPWKEHVLSAGPDVDFVLSAHAESDGSGPPPVVAAQYFSAPLLAIYRCAGPTWAACDGGKGISVETLDEDFGPFFAVQESDLDGDGIPDLLVTNSRPNATGALLAYSKPTGASGYTRHVLASGYAPAPKPLAGPGRGAPGKPFALPTYSPGEKPRVLLSGDDGGFVSVLTPTSKAVGEWSYQQTYLFNSTGTIGQLSWMVNASSGLIAFVPLFSEGRLEAWALPRIM